jgi:hypothetical protein
MTAVDFDKDELFAQDKEVNPAASDRGLELIMDMELFQEFLKLQFGGVPGPNAFPLVFEKLSERCGHFSSKH